MSSIIDDFREGFAAAIMGFVTGILFDSLLSITEEMVKGLPIPEMYAKLFLAAIILIIIFLFIMSVLELLNASILYLIGFLIGAIIIRDYSSALIAILAFLFSLLVSIIKNR